MSITLLRKGFIVPPKGASAREKEILDNTTGMEYILRQMGDWVPMRRGSQPKKVAKQPGDKSWVVLAGTASGKSTAMPSYLHLKFFDRTHKNIAVTQPRILTAMDIPSTIASVMPEIQLDKNIGYTTGPFKRMPKERGLIFSTVGVLTAQLVAAMSAGGDMDAFMRRYQFIIVDEVHERDLETDLCLYLLKKMLEEHYANPECPIVIMTSATFNPQLFMDYYGTPADHFISIKGASFPIQDNFADYSIANYAQYAALKAQQLHLDNLADVAAAQAFSRDIIIFVKGLDVATKIYERLHEFNSVVLNGTGGEIQAYKDALLPRIEEHYKRGGAADELKNMYILPIMLAKANLESGDHNYQNLFSRLETLNTPIWRPDKQGHIDMDKPPAAFVQPVRRIVIATNIAETGVTIDTLKYCIDTGFHLNVEFNPEIGCSVMFARSVPRGGAIQRRGRVGRKAEGYWYPCYTKETFESLQTDQLSKILVTDVTENVLSILIKEKETALVELVGKARSVDESTITFPVHRLMTQSRYAVVSEWPTNLTALDFIELPSAQAMGYSIEKLHMLGFIDDAYDITPTGWLANQIRFIGLELRKMILAGYAHGANILDLITIAAFVYTSKHNMFEKSFRLPNFLKIGDKEFEFYSRVLVADDFVNCLFIWNALQGFIQKQLMGMTTATLSSATGKGMLQSDDVQKWCENNGIKYRGLLQAISIRDQIIENMITIGLNPYCNSLDIPAHQFNINKMMHNLAEGLEEVKKIKLCVFEGFKCNVLVQREYGYQLLFRDIRVKIKSPLITELKGVSQKRPHAIVVSAYSLSQKFNAAQFEFVSEEFVSVLDNYITVDEGFFRGHAAP